MRQPSSKLKGHRMKQFQKGLIRMGALRPKTQAIPLCLHEMYRILSEMPIRLRIPTFLAWKTASRWSDVARLRKENITWLSEEEAIIHFVETKGAAFRPFRQDHIIHLIHAEPMNEVQRALEPLSPQSLITLVTSSEVNRYFRSMGLPYTTHSVKRGAMTVLMAAVRDDLLPLDLIPRMGKHLTKNPSLPDTTVRYLGDKVDLAVSLGTGLATCLL
eukprot:PhF_6_TR25532/c4_g1_i2/m.35757